MNDGTSTKAKPAPLGRGLSALFGDTDASYRPYKPSPQPQQPAAEAQQPVVPPVVTPPGTQRLMPVTWIQPGAFQPRSFFDKTALDELADSIRERGILEPLIVRPSPDEPDAYELIAGERRWRAAQLAGLHDVPVIVRELSDMQALEFGIIENVQRQDLSAIEEAEGYQRLITEFKYTQETLSKIVGKSRPHIANMLRVLTLPVIVKQMIASGVLSMGHARALVNAKDPIAMAKEIVNGNLSVRQAEGLARRESGKGSSSPGSSKAAATESADVLMLEKELERVVGMKVKIATQGKAGSLTVFYQDLDQLDEIIKRLRS